MKRLLPEFIMFLLMAFVGSSLSYADDSVWHGYYDGEEPLSEFGTGVLESYDCAAYFSGQTGVASGKTILAVRFAIQGIDLAENLKVWLSTSLPSDCNDADSGLFEVSTDGLKEGDFVEVQLPAPLPVPADGIFVGYSFSTKEPFPIFTTLAQTSQSGGFFIKTSKTYKEWKDFSQFKYGNLALQVKLDGSILGNAAGISSLPEVTGLAGASVILPMQITSHGIEQIESIDFTVVSSDGSSREFSHVFQVPIKTINESAVVPLDFKCGETAGIDYKTVFITKVNGKDNEWDIDTERRGAVITLESSMPRSTVMEEYTGTWCGWCPRGAVGIEALTSDFGNAFIGIAIHRNDPMEIPEYASILEKVEGFPSCTLNRSVGGDPFFGSVTGPGVEESYGIYKDVLAQQSELVAAKAGVDSEWIDEAGLRVKVTAECSLGYARDSDPAYKLVYVILADSLCGDTSKWFQNNDFHLPMAQHYKTDPYLGWLTEKGSIIRDFVYNHVAIAAAGVVSGLPFQTDGKWDIDTPKICGTVEFGLSDNDLVQYKDKLSAVVIILDDSTGKIVNAAKAPIGQKNTSDVQVTDQDNSLNGHPMFFDISGSRNSSLRKGINIVRYPDGTVKKIFVK